MFSSRLERKRLKYQFFSRHLLIETYNSLKEVCDHCQAFMYYNMPYLAILPFQI